MPVSAVYLHLPGHSTTPYLLVWYSCLPPIIWHRPPHSPRSATSRAAKRCCDTYETTRWLTVLRPRKAPHSRNHQGALQTAAHPNLPRPQLDTTQVVPWKPRETPFPTRQRQRDLCGTVLGYTETSQWLTRSKSLSWFCRTPIFKPETDVLQDSKVISSAGSLLEEAPGTQNSNLAWEHRRCPRIRLETRKRRWKHLEWCKTSKIIPPKYVAR